MLNLKQSDLQHCLLCTKGMMHGGDIQFYRVTIENFIVDTRAVQRQAGFEMAMGSAVLAQAMGTDPDIAMGVTAVGGFICQECFFEGKLPTTWEAASDAADKQPEERSRDDR